MFATTLFLLQVNSVQDVHNKLFVFKDFKHLGKINRVFFKQGPRILNRLISFQQLAEKKTAAHKTCAKQSEASSVGQKWSHFLVVQKAMLTFGFRVHFLCNEWSHNLVALLNNFWLWRILAKLELGAKWDIFFVDSTIDHAALLNQSAFGAKWDILFCGLNFTIDRSCNSFEREYFQGKSDTCSWKRVQNS